MEDDDKSRRNLMVVSACILLYVWLDVPANALQKRILGIDDFVIPPWKFWLVLSVAVSYQLYRFITLGLASPNWAATCAKWNADQKKGLLTAINHELATSNRKGQLSEALECIGTPLPIGNLAKTSTEPTLPGTRIRWDENPRQAWDAEFALECGTYNTMGEPIWTRVRFCPPRRAVRKFRAKCVLKLFGAPVATEYIMPLCLGLFSLFAALRMLWRVSSAQWV